MLIIKILSTIAALMLTKMKPLQPGYFMEKNIFIAKPGGGGGGGGSGCRVRVACRVVVSIFCRKKFKIKLVPGTKFRVGCA